jgi:hypothetical protein
LSFNPRVLFLHQNLFWSNHDYWLIIVNVWCLIIFQWLISNMPISLVCLYLVWILIYVVGHIFYVLEFFWILILFWQNFSCFCICFKFWFGFWFKLLLFYSIYSWTKYFGSTWLGQIRVRCVRPCLIFNLFY